MDRQARWTAILEMLAGSDPLSVESAAAKLQVSTATIRRDFDELAQRQTLVRTRGGARAAGGTAYDLPLRYKSATHADEKRRIGSVAAELVPARAVVGLTGGTTTTAVARALATREDLQADRGAPVVTVVTNALNIAQELIVHPNVKLVTTGGVARPQSYELVGPLAKPVLLELALDYAVVGVAAISASRGASTDNEAEAEVNRLLAERAAHVVVVADATKLGRDAFARICGIERIETLVTDASASEALVEPFVNAGVRVVRA
jgi:DeoR family transcriptional regulator of aga operon